MIKRGLSLVLIVCILLLGCATQAVVEVTPTPSATPILYDDQPSLIRAIFKNIDQLPYDRWQLVAFTTDLEMDRIYQERERPISLEIQEDIVLLYSSCNLIRYLMEVEENRAELLILRELKACLPQEIEDLEGAILAAFDSIESVEIDGDFMTVTYDASDQLTLKALYPPVIDTKEPASYPYPDKDS